MSELRASCHFTHCYFTTADEPSLWPPTYPKSACIIIHAVLHDNVEKVKVLLDSPDWYGVTDKFGNTLLHIAVKNKISNRAEVFKYLLSLDDYPVDAVNDNQETALMASLNRFNRNQEYFLKTLITCSADLNLQDFRGETALHKCCRITWDHKLMVEIFAMLLCYGADPSITDNCGYNAFEMFVIRKAVASSIWSDEYYFLLEHLFNLTFDKLECPKIDFHVLALLAVTNCPLFYKVYDCVEDVRIGKGVCKEIFEMDLKYLKLLKEKYEDAVCEIVSTSRWFYKWDMNLVRLENFEFLLESNLRTQTIDQIITTEEYIDSFIEGDGDEKMLTEKVCYLLSYGLTVSTEDLNILHNYFPNCELFKILLHMDLELERSDDDDSFARLYYDIKIDIENFHKPFWFTSDQADLLLGLCAHQEIKDFCSRRYKNEVARQVENLPQIPSLVECARNVFRKYFIEKMKITSARQFYTMVNSLPISTFHKDIITYFRKIY